MGHPWTRKRQPPVKEAAVRRPPRCASRRALGARVPQPPKRTLRRKPYMCGSFTICDSSPNALRPLATLSGNFALITLAMKGPRRSGYPGFTSSARSSSVTWWRASGLDCGAWCSCAVARLEWTTTMPVAVMMKRHLLTLFVRLFPPVFGATPAFTARLSPPPLTSGRTSPVTRRFSVQSGRAVYDLCLCSIAKTSIAYILYNCKYRFSGCRAYPTRRDKPYILWWKHRATPDALVHAEMKSTISGTSIGHERNRVCPSVPAAV